MSKRKKRESSSSDVDFTIRRGHVEDHYRVPKKELKSLFKTGTNFIIKGIPAERACMELGMCGSSQVVNEISPDYTPPPGRKGRPLKYKVINDEILEVDNTDDWWPLFAFSFVGLSILIYGFIWAGMPTAADWHITLIAAILLSPFILACSYFVVQRFYCPIFLLRFNRLAGTVEMPKPWFKGWRGETKTIPFLEFQIFYSGTTFKSLAIVYPEAKLYAPDLGLEEKDMTLALVVWFMDKNRPLPPGKIFDIYRLKDYERRKAAGFPEPLFFAFSSDKEFDTRQRPDLSKLTLVKRVGTNDGIQEIVIDPQTLENESAPCC